MILLTKKWENKSVYKTGHGVAHAWKVGDSAFVEVDPKSVIVKYLKSLYGFEVYKEEKKVKVDSKKEVVKKETVKKKTEKSVEKKVVNKKSKKSVKKDLK